MLPGAAPVARDVVLIFLSNFVWSLFLAIVFTQWAGISSFLQGMKAGALIGFLTTLAFDLYFLAFMNLYSNTLMAVDVVVGAIFLGIVGGVVGWMLGMGKKTDAAAT